jgi:hypothetical protein
MNLEITRDELPFRVFEQAHKRLSRALAEYQAARADLEQAFLGLREAGYFVRATEPADVIELRAPLPPEETPEPASLRVSS